jgi:hypothetical protein
VKKDDHRFHRFHRWKTEQRRKDARVRRRSDPSWLGVFWLHPESPSSPHLWNL